MPKLMSDEADNPMPYFSKRSLSFKAGIYLYIGPESIGIAAALTLCFPFPLQTATAIFWADSGSQANLTKTTGVQAQW